VTYQLGYAKTHLRVSPRRRPVLPGHPSELSCVALLTLFFVYVDVGFGLESSGSAAAVLLVAGILVAMALSVVGIFWVLWFRPNSYRRVND
jgi:hypothetical protein